MVNYGRRIVKTEFIKQYGHTWRVFERIVKDFDKDAWRHTGRGTITPVRLAFHILQGVKYYIENSMFNIYNYVIEQIDDFFICFISEYS